MPARSLISDTHTSYVGDDAAAFLGYAHPMPRRPSQHRLRVLAVQVCQAVVELTRQRSGRGEQWVMLKSVQDRLGAPDEELQAAVAFAVSRGTLMAQGDPVHSIAVHRQHL